MVRPAIRPARPAEAAQLAVLACQVWLHTYADQGISAAIAGYVLSELQPARYQALLADPACAVLVAEAAGHLQGFAVLKRQQPCPCPGGPDLELQTLYVAAPFLGQGLGKMLLNATETAAGGPLWLSVNAHNARAIAFYERQAYQRIGAVDFVLDGVRHPNHVYVSQRAQPGINTSHADPF